MTSADVPTVLEINTINAADVEPLTGDELEVLRADSAIALVAVSDESSVVGFCLVVDRTGGSPSERSAWAFEHGADVHLERVAFDMRYSGRGLGRELFEELDARLAELAGTATLVLASIVRIDPPNEHAVGFHASRGFVEVDRRTSDEVTWSLTTRSLRSDRSDRPAT